MNPLSSQQSQTQYYITTTGMPSLAPTSDQHLMTSATLPAVQPVISTLTTNPSMNNHQQSSHFMDANKFVSTTSYVPVLLSNQSLITNIEQQQQLPNISPSIINVTSSPVVAAPNIPLMSSNPGSNVTYVVTSPQAQNFGSGLTGQNTVSVLLTAPTTMATSGHVAAAPLIIRNTPTQIKQQTQQHQLHNQTFNTQQLNAPPAHPEVLKQIGNTTQMATTATLAAGTTLLKTSLVQSKPVAATTAQQQLNRNPKQNQQLNPQQMPINCDKSGKSASFSMESKTTSSSMNINNNNITQSSLITQAVQKLPQVSLLQNSKNKQSANIIVSGPNNTTSSNVLTGKTTSEKINEKSCVIKNPNEIRVGNLSAEVSLIKKPNLHTDITTNNNNAKAETASLLKSAIDLNRKTEKSPDNILQISANNNKQSENSFNEKQESLLKNKNKNSECTPSTKAISPRNQRSTSYNSALKPTQNQNSSNINNSSERRHSEPAKLEKVVDTKSVEVKKSSKVLKSNTAMLSENLDNIQEDFEDEEYLESSGEKSKETMSEITIHSQEYNSEKESLNESIEEKKTETPKDTDETNDDKRVVPTIKEVTTINDEYNHKNERNNEEQNKKQESDSDDDVTILPMDESLIEPIEIDDDDEEEVNANGDASLQMPVHYNTSPSSKDKEKFSESLFCDEQILISSSSSISNHSLDQLTSTSSASKKSPKLETISAKTTAPILKKSLTERKHQSLVKDEPPSSNCYSTVIDMLSNFNMLNWRERLGTGRGTNMKFQLNEFNLVQLHEKIPTRTKPHTSFEKPVYERDDLQIRSGNTEPLIYYMCRRCKVRAPALDFLAPEFCSLYCLKRDCRKRQRDDSNSTLRKKQRYVVSNSNPPPLAYITQPKFRWSNYLKANYTSMAAPISLFLNPFPTGPNNFKIGMKLEAIDPENCALFCVCTVVDINGYRLKLSFDGYDSAYDFWLNADSMDIFPPGWCAKTNRILQPPKGISSSKFNWGAYLNREKAMAAPRYLFTHLNSSSLIPRNPFQVGMHLEAEDLNDTGKLCVASVADVLDDRIRIHFDGWDDCYDIIVDINSPYIHPCGWHESRHQLVVPPDCENSAFNWVDYIRKQGKGVMASDEIFVPREAIHFKPNMKLEVVDPRNSSLIRPATVVSHKGHRVKLHLDGWPNDYCFWLEDDSPDLHPIGWCDATGHGLEPPPGFQMAKQKMPCPTSGCRGIGNAKKMFMNIHSSRDCCPYVPENWRIVMEKPPRVGFEEIVRSLPRQAKYNTQQINQRLSDQQILERLQLLDNIKTRNVLMQQDKVSTRPKELIGFSLANVKKEEKESQETKHNTTTPPSSSSASTSHKSDKESALGVNVEIAKEFLCDYGPRLQQTYNLWQSNFTFDAGKIKRNPMLWSIAEVGVFVDLYLNCRQTAALFAQEDIDGQAFLLLQQSDLTGRLGLKLGPAVKLYTCILQLRTLAVTKFNVAYRKASIK